MQTKTVFSSAMDNTLDWALGYPVSAGHYALTLLLVLVGGGFLFQKLAATFNARRYAWLFAGPAWGIGLFAIWVGMSSSLVNQPEGLAGGSRFVTCLLGAAIAIVAVAGPATMGLMSVGYGAAVSIWTTIMAGVGIVGAASTLVGAGALQGLPKVLHWQGEVSMQDTRSPRAKTMNDDRKILDKDFRLITGAKSASIVMVRGHKILLLPDSMIRIASLDDEPRVTLERGWMFSRTSMAADRNMRFETSSAGFKVSNASVLLITGTGRTWAIVADGGIYSGKTVYEAEDVVKAGQFVVVGASGQPPPAPLTPEYKEHLKRYSRYFENPFSAPNRALITGSTAHERKEEDEKKKEEDEKKKADSESKSGDMKDGKDSEKQN